MGFSVYYRSTRPVAPDEADAIKRAAARLCRDRSWLGCEPVGFFPGRADGHLFGRSKPNFQPHPDDAASAARSGLPDGTTRDLLDVLCQLSRAHRIDWEVSHDYSGGPVGYIRRGVCEPEALTQLEAFADLADVLGGLAADPGTQPGGSSPAASRGGDEDGDADDGDGPHILPYRPKGEERSAAQAAASARPRG
jgi:hypothetical protein